jgi:hypothetical protein
MTSELRITDVRAENSGTPYHGQGAVTESDKQATEGKKFS